MANFMPSLGEYRSPYEAFLDTQKLESGIRLNETQARLGQLSVAAKLYEFTQELERQAAVKRVMGTLKEKRAQNLRETATRAGADISKPPPSNLLSQLIGERENAAYVAQQLEGELGPDHPAVKESYGRIKTITDDIRAQEKQDFDIKKEIYSRQSNAAYTAANAIKENNPYSFKAVLDEGNIPESWLLANNDQGQPLVTFDSRGMPIFSKGAYEFFYSKGDQAKSQNERLTEARNAALARNEEEQKKLAREKFNEDKIQHREKIAIDRGNLHMRSREYELRREEKNERLAEDRRRKDLEEAAKDRDKYTSLTQTKKFGDAKIAFETARQYIFDEQGKLRPYSKGDSSGDHAFVNAYLQSVGNTALDARWKREDIAKLQNVPERIKQSIGLLIKGKRVDTDVKAEMFESMRKKFENMNKQQAAIRQSFEKTIRARGLDPDNILPDDVIYAPASNGDALLDEVEKAIK